jgi:5-formyltetrahydrofolate cyclo-ligase
MGALRDEKEELRCECAAIRGGLTPQEVEEGSAELCRLLGGWDVLRSAERVLAYLAFGNELDVTPLFDLLPGIVWAAPRIQGQQLLALTYDPKHLTPHPFGMMEPERAMPEIDPSTLDVVLVPGIAFGEQGARLGYGGGYYDRFLATTSAIRVGIAHECCLVDRLPSAKRDQRMDWIATPSRLIECVPKRRSR